MRRGRQGMFNTGLDYAAGRYAKVIACAVLLSLTGCGVAKQGEDAPVTLYRNSSADLTMRIHFSTFNADDGVNYNLSNCQMAARLLNANIRQLHSARTEEDETYVPATGFWCEIGGYKETGQVPFEFDADFPTIAQ